MSNINPNINKFFNKLYSSFPSIVSINKSKEFGNMRYVYKTRDSSKWFVKYKTDQEVFLFGKIKDDTPQPPLLTLTFDKTSAYSKDCSGIINSKNVYINVEYFINNYPHFRTDLAETTIDVFINSRVNSINVIKLGNYVDNIDFLIDNLDILLNQLDEFKPIEEPKSGSTIKRNDSKTCEICGKKLKNDKFSICPKCSKKRATAKFLVSLLKHVEPQTPFEKDDLKQIYNDEYYIKDYLWRLEDFDLVNRNKDEYCLVNSTKLNEFIEEYGTMDEIHLKKEEKKEEPKKLNKKCSICKKTLPSSKFYTSDKTDDGFEDYCRKCKKLIFAANCLKEILNQVSPSSEFKLNDLENNFENPMEFKGRLYELQHNDLLVYDSDKDIYTLADLETCQNFLDNYYIEGSITVEPEIKKETDDEDLTEEQQMNIVIESIKNGKTDKEAAEIAGVNLYNITYWFNEGKNNYGEDYIDFYNRYTEAKKEAKLNSYKNFYVIDSFNIKEDFTIADTLRKQQMEQILKEIGSGSSLETAAFNSGIEFETFRNWYKRGKQNLGREYIEFYEKINILRSPMDAPKFDDGIKKERLDGYSDEKADEELNLPELYKHILNPLPHKFKKIFKGAKESESGFAWVKKRGNSWTYDRQHKDKRYHITRQNIYELYYEVKKQGHTWGIRNLEKAKETLKQSTIPSNIEDEINAETYKELNIPEPYKHILDPLPQEFKQIFIGAKESESGFAWVKRDKNSWRYDRRIKDQRQSISRPNIYELYNEVKKQGFIWGLRNLENAKITLKQCEIPDIYTDNDEDIFKHILNPIAPEYNKRFKKPTSSGFAWVKKSKNSWKYNNKLLGEYIQNINLYYLYLDVKEKNLPWGVRDLEKAKKSLAQCGKPEMVTENTVNTSEFEEDYLFEHILDPIPREYLKRFKKPNSSGIAWVKKISNDTWWYNNPKDDALIYESNIYTLYLEVKKQNLPWGVRDLEKAKKSLAQCGKPNIQPKIPTEKEIPNTENSEVNCICLEGNDHIKIIIDGLIENDNFLNTLYKFKSYENNIKKIVSDRHTQYTELFIELELEKNRLSSFKDKISMFGWKIIN